MLNYLGSSGESSSDWDLAFSINQLQCSTIWDLLVNHLGLGPVIFDQSASAFVHNMPRRGQRSLSPSRSIREVRQRMSTVADSSLINVTNLRDVIDVPVPIIDV